MLIFEKNNKLYISFNNKVDEPNLEVNEEGVTVLNENEDSPLFSEPLPVSTEISGPVDGSGSVNDA